jgi:uncharacterized protein (TIGR04255 family)
MPERWPHLKHAPIVEATIDFRIAKRDGIKFDDLSKITKTIESNYPSNTPRYRFDGQIEIGVSPSIKSEQQQDAIVYTSAKKFVFQSQLDGFTISKQAPYESWDNLYLEAQSLWSQYQAIAMPKGVIRVGVRFINRLPLPFPIRDYKDYLTAPPEIPARLPQSLLSFISRIVIPLPSLDAFAVISQISANPENDILPVTLDIDIVKQSSDILGVNDAWGLVQAFHDEKNRIFFESITERMVELCQRD